MPLTVVTPPAVEPITLALAKVQCSIDPDVTKWDDLLTTIAIPAARARAEQITQRYFAQQTLELTLDEFPCGDFSLGAAPVSAIDSIQYVDAAGALQTVSSLSYLLDAASVPACVLLAAGASWPVSSGANSVRVRFTAGYTDPAVPRAMYADAYAWMLLQIATIFRQRELFAQGITVAELPENYADRLLDSARVWV